MPGFKTSYDISPHAGAKGFDDSSWTTLEAKQLADRRGGGRSRSCGTDQSDDAGQDRLRHREMRSGADRLRGRLRGSVGERLNAAPRGHYQPATIQGFTSRTRGHRRWQSSRRQGSVAIFGINGPISVAPPNFVFFRQASVEL